MKGPKGPFAFNQLVFSNFFKSLKIRTAWRKDFFDTLRRPVWPPGTGCEMFRPRWLLWLGRADMQSAPTGLVGMIRIFSEFCRRGGLYGRPEPGALCSSPDGCFGWARTRDARCVRRGRIGHRTAARAAIQAAPTGSQPAFRRGGYQPPEPRDPDCMPRAIIPFVGADAHIGPQAPGQQGSTSGPWMAGPWRNSAVGAAYMAARNRARNVPAPVVALAGQGGYAIRPYRIGWNDPDFLGILP